MRIFIYEYMIERPFDLSMNIYERGIWKIVQVGACTTGSWHLLQVGACGNQQIGACREKEGWSF